MSFNEARADGIRMVRAGYNTCYFPRCQVCGIEVRSFTYSRDKRYLCAECRNNIRRLEASGLSWETIFRKKPT